MNKYQEALDLIIETSYCYSLGFLKYVATIQELINKHKKYKWHDLRKNPNDLPPSYRQVLCFNGYEYTTIYSKSPMFYKCLKKITPPIIAWKYIEEFEDE